MPAAYCPVVLNWDAGKPGTDLVNVTPSIGPNLAPYS